MLERACKKKCAGLATWHKTWIWANWPWDGQCYKGLVKRIVQVWPLGPKPGFGPAGPGMANVRKGL